MSAVNINEKPRSRNSPTYDEIPLHVLRGSRDKIKQCANRKCMTMQRFIRESINCFAGETLIETNIN